jgi:hypothetical protein
VEYQEDKESGLNCALGAGIMTDTASNPEIKGFQDSPAGIEMMEAHYFAIHNPERFYTQEPMEAEYKREQTKKAEAWLVQDGYRLIASGEIAPSLFGGI